MTCHVQVAHLAPREFAVAAVKNPLSKVCIAKLRAMPRTIRSGPIMELPKMVRTMIGGGR